MLFWFNNNEAFSLVDALVKLILVITASIFIICFCHRLTNYRKTRIRRYKSNSSLNFAVAAIAGGNRGVHTPFIESSSRANDPGTRQLMAILSAANAAHLFPSHSSNIYTHQALVEAQLQRQDFGHTLNHNQIFYPLYTSTLDQLQYNQLQQQQHQLVTTNGEENNINDQCPTYEEAIAASQQPQFVPQLNENSNNQETEETPDYRSSENDSERDQNPEVSATDANEDGDM